jgi:two-component system, chemotaxis family, chemotaxis protein CheY
MKRKAEQRILVMEDDATTRQFLRSSLEKAGYAVTVCKNGQEGVAEFAKSKFDLVITDISMPLVDGIDAILLISKKDAAVPIIAVSGTSRSESLLKVADYFAADATLQKPFTGKQLCATVAKVMRT